MKRVITSILTIFLVSTLNAQHIVQERQPCGIDQRLNNLKQKSTENIDLTNTFWRGNITTETTGFSIYTVPTVQKLEDRWGTFIHFEEGSFYTSYSAQCGNDCFSSTIGTYRVLKNNQIEFFIEKITRNGYCPNETEIVEKSVGIFQMSQSEKGIQFTRI